ncbi:uncharacterized protein LOC110431171 [Sorghum bicolor]|uniref:uncharacterized protein LOC110431171 n=1 Tax=Sorghum bicolor TaxID=4558 RepID=UPI000B4260B2|nr:uncharacterized protein LOC110431171 [Sorghum bicolor]|eukprot:XP_021305562.1 uncharacterized protein LOC110431171 [Sorghum bicolor]
MYKLAQALKAMSLEKSVFLHRERDAWATCENEKAAREAAEGELAKECEISAELRQKCTALATEAREAREKVAPMEKRADLSAAQSEVVRWHRSSAENEKRAEESERKMAMAASAAEAL